MSCNNILDVSSIEFCNNIVNYTQDTNSASIEIGNLDTTTGDFSGNRIHLDSDKYNVSIGYDAGSSDLSANTIAIGKSAGSTSQNEKAIAIGYNAGSQQSANAIAIGPNAGSSQNEHAVAIGQYAGYQDQSTNAIAIGSYAGYDSQSANSIILNAQTDLSLNSDNSGLFIAPIREDPSGTNILVYDLSSKEIKYSSVLSSLTVNEIYCNRITSRNDNNCYIIFQDIIGADGADGADGSYEIWMHSNGAVHYTSVSDRPNGETIIRGRGPIVHSDDRLKHNERNITNSLDIIKKLNPYTYDMTNKFYDASYVGDISGIYYYKAGFIAQQIRQIEEISFCSIGEEYDICNNPIPMGIDYNSLFTYNVAATKELDSIVQIQQTKLTELEAENLLLKSNLNEILREMGKETI